MVDTVDKETRSRMMRSIKAISRLEMLVCSSLWKRGYRFRKNSKTLVGKPDISIKKYKIVIFIDSCFWHYCPVHGHIPKSREDYWKKKLENNRNRDMMVSEYYKLNGWNLLRLWEHEFKHDFDNAIDKIVNFIRGVKLNYKSTNRQTKNRNPQSLN